MNVGLTITIIVLAVLVMVLTLLVLGLGKDIKGMFKKQDDQDKDN